MNTLAKEVAELDRELNWGREDRPSVRTRLHDVEDALAGQEIAKTALEAARDALQTKHERVLGRALMFVVPVVSVLLAHFLH